MNFVNGDKDNSLFALAFSSKEGLVRYMDKHSLDLMLLPEDAMEDPDIMECLNGVNVLKLLEEPPSPGNSSGGVYKYSRGKDICQALVNAARANEATVKSDLFETYGVISPIGRSGKTRVAKAICAMDEVRGGLYVGLEDFGLLEEPSGDTGELLISNSSAKYTMSEIAYLIKSRSKELIYYVEKAVVNEGPLAMLQTPLSYLDIKELDAADMKWFVSEIISWGRYTTIVFDIGGSVLGDISVLGIFDMVVVTELNDETSRNKMDAFKHVLKIHELGKVVSRMKEVVAPDVPYDDPEMTKCVAGFLENW